MGIQSVPQGPHQPQGPQHQQSDNKKAGNKPGSSGSSSTSDVDEENADIELFQQVSGKGDRGDKEGGSDDGSSDDVQFQRATTINKSDLTTAKLKESLLERFGGGATKTHESHGCLAGGIVTIDGPSSSRVAFGNLKQDPYPVYTSSPNTDGSTKNSSASGGSVYVGDDDADLPITPDGQQGLNILFSSLHTHPLTPEDKAIAEARVARYGVSLELSMPSSNPPAMIGAKNNSMCAAALMMLADQKERESQSEEAESEAKQAKEQQALGNKLGADEILISNDNSSQSSDSQSSSNSLHSSHSSSGGILGKSSSSSLLSGASMLGGGSSKDSGSSFAEGFLGNSILGALGIESPGEMLMDMLLKDVMKNSSSRTKDQSKTNLDGTQDAAKSKEQSGGSSQSSDGDTTQTNVAIAGKLGQALLSGSGTSNNYDDMFQHTTPPGTVDDDQSNNQSDPSVQIEAATNLDGPSLSIQEALAALNGISGLPATDDPEA